MYEGSQWKKNGYHKGRTNMIGLFTNQGIRDIFYSFDMRVDCFSDGFGEVFVVIRKVKFFDLFNIRLKARIRRIMNAHKIVGIRYIISKEIVGL